MWGSCIYVVPAERGGPNHRHLLLRKVSTFRAKMRRLTRQKFAKVVHKIGGVDALFLFYRSLRLQTTERLLYLAFDVAGAARSSNPH